MEQVQEQGGPVFADPMEFDLARARLARRRKIAADLLANSGINPIREVGGFAIGPTNIFSSGVNRALGHFTQNKADDEEQALAAREAEASRNLLSSIPDKPGPERSAAQAQALRMPSLREAIKAQMEADRAEANRLEASEQKAADRQMREMDILDRGEQRAADRLAREELKRTPSVIVHTGGGGSRSGGVKAPSGYRYNEDGTALEPIPGGPADRSGAGAKPMSAAQEKAALELGSEFSTVNRLASTFKPEYSGDLRSSLQRQFGKVAGGAAPEKTQEMTRWWSDQAMMDELPKRHALFGAALTANEQRSWNDASINPSLSSEVIQKRLDTRQKIMLDAAERMKGSVEAGGRSGKQFEAATGKLETAKPAAAGPVLVNSRDEWQALKPGTPYVTVHGERGVR